MRRYNKEFMMRTGGMQGSSDSMYVTAEERYQEIFAGVKLFSAGHNNCDDCSRSCYVLDTYTGENPDLSDIVVFNKEMNKSRTHLTNYDKACFYLEFNELSKNTTSSARYYKFISKGSIYDGIPGTGMIGYGNLSLDWHKYSGYIDRSSPRIIYIGAVTYEQVKKKKVTMYKFNFDKLGQLISIEYFDVD